jgi:threonine/homoserine efflux transporter RhtA
MDAASRTQGGLICVAVVVLGAWFLLGVLKESYWALALPVALLVFFALGLTFWVGYTIATVQVEPYEENEAPAADAESDADTSPERRA